MANVREQIRDAYRRLQDLRTSLYDNRQQVRLSREACRSTRAAIAYIDNYLKNRTTISD
jgi:hypothetical protein